MLICPTGNGTPETAASAPQTASLRTQVGLLTAGLLFLQTCWQALRPFVQALIQEQTQGRVSLAAGAVTWARAGVTDMRNPKPMIDMTESEGALWCRRNLFIGGSIIVVVRNQIPCRPCWQNIFLDWREMRRT